MSFNTQCVVRNALKGTDQVCSFGEDKSTQTRKAKVKRPTSRDSQAGIRPELKTYLETFLQVAET